MPPADVLRGAQEVTRDGKLLVFFQTKEKGADLWLMPVDASSAPVLLVPNAVNPARISPDGRLISFRSGEAGRSEIFVQPLSASATKTRVSTEGADMAGWSPDGRELLYHTTDGHIVAVPVHSSGSNEIALGSRVTLFATRGKWPWRDFDIAPDGKRFLAVVTRLMSAEQSLTVVLNWVQEATR
jgi:Tol biopolymer transport system component